MNRKKFLKDILMNIISSGLPLIILQLIALPMVAKVNGDENFGVVVSTISIVTLLSFPVGNVLNNIRMLKDAEYKNQNIHGDFNNILVKFSLASISILIFIYLFFYAEIKLLNLILLTIIASFSIVKEYLIVQFRIDLNYKKILVNNVVISMGYTLGIYFFLISNYWEYIYVCGLLLSIIYLLFNTTLLKENYKKTFKFKETFKDYFLLLISVFLKTASTYADKIILLPLLGPKNVAIYYAASIIGKIISMFITPINNVILSYLTKIEKVNKKKYIRSIPLIIIGGIFSYLLIIVISPFFLRNLYSQWAESSLEIVYITALTTIITLYSGILHPFVLRYNKVKYQVYINSINLIFYLIIAVIFSHLFGLKGFAVASLLSVFTNLVTQLVILIRFK